MVAEISLQLYSPRLKGGDKSSVHWQAQINVIYTYNEILFGHKKEQSLDKCYRKINGINIRPENRKILQSL